MSWRELGRQEAGPFQVTDLKICDLCGALNLASNGECFVCGWHGRFERRPEVVQIAMELMERQHGRLLLQLLTSPRVYHESLRGPLISRLLRFLARIRHWFFG
jgi:hypothetical protein